ncbi:MAG: ribose-phosphate diphosphokinase [Holosporaceae bacterium]|jgi:ribose-phosphate pyrophosphokinase|nr:ribose-phosphate diphosphokinase [Holosporaceae bacterium]
MEIIHTSNSREPAKSLAKELSFSAFSANVRRFANGEIVVSLPKSFREAIVLSSPVKNEDWIELFLLLDALREAEKLILCLPYMGYSRQDKLIGNESFGAGLFPRLLDTFNISRCIILENHCEPLIRTPTVSLSATGIFETNIMSKYSADRIVVVSPDIGGAYRANEVAKALRCGFAICNKARDVFGELKKTEVIGDVRDKICILIDDIVDTGATLCHAADALAKSGCRGTEARVVHGVLSPGSIARLEKSDIIEIVITDSICGNETLPPKFKKISVASLMADAIRCML